MNVFHAACGKTYTFEVEVTDYNSDHVNSPVTVTAASNIPRLAANFDDVADDDERPAKRQHVVTEVV
jgi:hypothetical protein